MIGRFSKAARSVWSFHLLGRACIFSVLMLPVCDLGAEGSGGLELENTVRRLDLAGEWRIRFADEPDFSDPSLNDEQWQSIPVPSNWRDLRDYDGRAWYRKHFQLSIDASRDAYAIYIGSIGTANEIYVNGHFLGRRGSIDESEAHWYDLPVSYTVPAQALRAGDNVVAVRVRGYYAHFSEGITAGPVLLDDFREVQRMRALRDAKELSFSAVFVLVALYFLLFFVRVPQIRSHLYFGIFMLMLAAYVTLRVPLVHEMADDFLLLKRLEYIVLFLLPAPFVLFWAHLHFGSVRPWHVPLVLVWVLFACVPFLGSRVIVWSNALGYWMIALAPVSLVIAGSLAWKAFRGHAESRIIVGGVFVLLLTILNDSLMDRSIIESFRMSSYGTVALVAAISISLVQSFVHMQRESDATLERLRELDRLKSSFVGNLTDSLLEPAKTISAYVGSLDGDSGSREAVYQSLRSSGESLARLLDRVLLLSQLQSGGLRSDGEVLKGERLEQLLGNRSLPAEIAIRCNPELLRTAWQILEEWAGGNVEVSPIGAPVKQLALVARGHPERAEPAISRQVLREIARAFGGNMIESDQWTLQLLIPVLSS